MPKEIPVRVIGMKKARAKVTMAEIKKVRKNVQKFSILVIDDSIAVVGGGKMVLLGIPDKTLPSAGVLLVASIIDDALQAVQYEIEKKKNPKTRKKLTFNS